MSINLTKIRILQNLIYQNNYGYNLWKFNQLMGSFVDKSHFYRLIREMVKDNLIQIVNPPINQKRTNRKTNWYSISQRGLEYLESYEKILIGDLFFSFYYRSMDDVKYFALLAEKLKVNAILVYIYSFKSYKDLPTITIFAKLLENLNINLFLKSTSNLPENLVDLYPNIQILSPLVRPENHSIGIILCFDLFFIPISELKATLEVFSNILTLKNGFLLTNLPIPREQYPSLLNLNKFYEIISRDFIPVRTQEWINLRVNLIEQRFQYSYPFTIRTGDLVIYSNNDIPRLKDYITLLKK